MATLEDIAKKVGVSKSTVSKALNGAGDVSQSMRRMVLEAAVELGYSRLRRVDDVPRLAIFITNMNYLTTEDFGYDILVGFRKMAEPSGCVIKGCYQTKCDSDIREYSCIGTWWTICQYCTWM